MPARRVSSVRRAVDEGFLFLCPEIVRLDARFGHWRRVARIDHCVAVRQHLRIPVIEFLSACIERRELDRRSASVRYTPEASSITSEDNVSIWRPGSAANGCRIGDDNWRSTCCRNLAELSFGVEADP